MSITIRHRIAKRVRWHFNKQIKLRLWSFRNWREGYKYGPVQRFRCCDHTTPFHYRECQTRATR